MLDHVIGSFGLTSTGIAIAIAITIVISTGTYFCRS